MISATEGQALSQALWLNNISKHSAMFILEMNDIFSTKAMRNSRYESIVQKVRHDSVSAPKGKNDFRIHVQPKSLQKAVSI